MTVRRIALFILCLSAAPVLAGPREDTAAAITRCGAYADNRDYLQCIYGAVQPLRAALGLPPAPAQQQRLAQHAAPGFAPPSTAPLTPTATPAQSGFLGSLFGDGLRMTAYSFDKRGFFTVTLSNGQVWQQVAGDTAFAQFGGKPSDYIVSLTPRDGGKAVMDVRGESGSLTVQHLR
jgi:hypothetical protein